MKLQDKSTSEVLAQAVQEEQAPYAANAELDRRFGEGASDRLAEYFTASHASQGDMQRLAWTETDLLVEIANGTHQHTGRTDTTNGIFCRCGHRTAP